jgi:hypothetical protein
MHGTAPSTPSQRRLGVGRGRLIASLLGAGIVTAAAGVAALQGSRGSPTVGADAPRPSAQAATTWERPVVDAATLADLEGIRVVQVAVTGDGGLLDLRIQVVDPDKAAAVHDLTWPPALIDETSNAVADELLMGHSHTAPFKAGQTYYFVFQNPGNLVQRGGTVSVLLGHAELAHIAVR